MTELGLNEIKKEILELLQCFADFCKKNNIAYFLSNGTLLGAIKYNGFIPWDDDIDVLVPRDDYDRLMRLFEDSNSVVLLAPERNAAYNYPFAKLCNVDTTLEEENIDNGVTLGVNIDIFPLDKWAPSLNDAVQQAKKLRKCTKLHAYIKTQKFNPGENRSGFGKMIRKVMHPICKRMPSRLLRDAMMKEATKYRSLKNCQFMGCVVWPAYAEREILSEEVFSATTVVEFEGRNYPAPIGYDTYLRSLYGDYTLDPPLSKQVTHHKFKVYWKTE